MTDTISKKHRSWNMSRIKSANTKPELSVRKELFKRGHRYRLNGKVSRKVFAKGILPGKPDIILAKYKIVIFVNGCFWHHHLRCGRATWPKSNREYWVTKIRNNIKRDNENIITLKKLGWSVVVIWECETDNIKLQKKIDMIIKNLKK